MENKNSINFKLLARVLREAMPYKKLFILAFTFAISLAVLMTVPNRRAGGVGQTAGRPPADRTAIGDHRRSFARRAH